MNNGISERDWRIFRELHAVAEERLCARILEEIRGQVAAVHGGPSRERYRELLGLIESRNDELARGFDDFRRSTALAQLGIIHSMGLLNGAELRRLSPETLQVVEMYGPIPEAGALQKGPDGSRG
jgi:hypothetical protein